MEIYENIATAVDRLRNIDPTVETSNYEALVNIVSDLIATAFNNQPVSLCLKTDPKTDILTISFRIYIADNLFIEYIAKKVNIHTKISPTKWKEMIYMCSRTLGRRFKDYFIFESK